MKAAPRSRVQNIPYSRPLKMNEVYSSSSSISKVNVFCRVKPLQCIADLSCVRFKNSTTVILLSPEQNKHGTQRELKYTFKHVFEPSAHQREVFTVVAKPLVENLLRGQNGLLFTYGVTGSGKTFTMTGDVRQRGVMPLSLDALFCTISSYQAKKYIFKPDRLNGFEILSEEDALHERQCEINRRFAVGSKNIVKQKHDSDISSQESFDTFPLEGLDENNIYSVFITYVEIYNNSVYDLLEDESIQKSLQSKIIREDAYHNMFVHGVTEIEVKSVEEAIDVYQLGHKRKRMGHTLLNAESSRSHSVFNIRLVQAPVEKNRNMFQDKQSIIISQLSLVDLAGSERSSRTKNTGVRLREAGNINNSLLTLRTCLEYLRENQQQHGNQMKKIPYRDSKLTHMFKNYFDGDGQVSMIVCINPRVEDFDENTQVMKFAEMSQEVQIARALPIKPDFETLGRQKEQRFFKIADNKINNNHFNGKKYEGDIGIVYTLGPGFPDYETICKGKKPTNELIQYLIQRTNKRKTLRENLENRCENFHLHLMQIEQENVALRTEMNSLKVICKQQRERAFTLENKLRENENTIDTLNSKLGNRERQIDEINRKLSKHQSLLSQREEECEKEKKKFNSKLALEVGKKDRELELKLRQQKVKMQEKVRIREEKLRLVSNIIKSDKINTLVRSQSTENIFEQKPLASKGPLLQLVENSNSPEARSNIYCTPRHVRGLAPANNRHRRSRSVGEKWIEHRAAHPVPLGTIMQPFLKNRKSITKLTSMKDITGHKATKYCLLSQEADTDGDVETKLYKGNVIPTCGGGAQVVFDDIEFLKQKSPMTSPNRKRRSSIGDEHGTDQVVAAPNTLASTSVASFVLSNTSQDIGSRCNVGIEGHNVKRTKM